MFLADYSASKAAVINIMQSSAFQLAGTNVRCNAICPGLIETGMTNVVWEAARKRGTVGNIGQINPLKRGGVSDEIARVALFLGSDEYVAFILRQCFSCDPPDSYITKIVACDLLQPNRGVD